MGDELVKGVAANEALEVVEEVEALLVGNGAEGVIGVDALVVDDELGELGVVAEECDGVL